MSNNDADGTVETPEIDWEARAKKAEAKIVDMKKTTENPKEKEDTEEKQEESKASDNEKENKTALDEERIKQIAKEAVESYKIENNIANTEASSLSGDPVSSNSFKPVTTSDFDKMSAEAKAKYMEASEEAYGEVSFSISE